MPHAASAQQAAVFCNNCNVLLHAAMVKGGQEDDCDACGELDRGWLHGSWSGVVPPLSKEAGCEAWGTHPRSC